MARPQSPGQLHFFRVDLHQGRRWPPRDVRSSAFRRPWGGSRL